MIPQGDILAVDLDHSKMTKLSLPKGYPICCRIYANFSIIEHYSGYPSSELKGICPRGNNKVVIIIFHVYDKCLFLMLELY
jgi:hypothetical protein